MWKGFKTTGLVFKEAFQGWSEDNIPRLGASIAFYTVFSLAPLLIIAIAIAGLAFGEQATQGKVVHEFAGLLGYQGAHAVEGMIKNAYHPKSGLIATSIGLAALFIGATGVFIEIQSALKFHFVGLRRGRFGHRDCCLGLLFGTNSFVRRRSYQSLYEPRWGSGRA